jgi:hypothetical protein
MGAYLNLYLARGRHGHEIGNQRENTHGGQNHEQHVTA